jgi:hypothetical protein
MLCMMCKAHSMHDLTLPCRCLGGLEAWGLAVDSLRQDNIIAALQLDAEEGAAAEPDSNPSSPAVPAAQPDPEIMAQVEQLLAQAKALPPAVRDATINQVRGWCGDARAGWEVDGGQAGRGWGRAGRLVGGQWPVRAVPM